MEVLMQISSSKFLLFFVLCLSANNILQIASYTKEEFEQLAKACNGTDEILKISRKYEVPETEAGKCFVRCTLKILGMMNPSGEIDKDASIQVMIKSWPTFSSKLNTELFTECYNQVSPVQKELAGSCELAYKLMKCLNIESRKHGYYKAFLQQARR